MLKNLPRITSGKTARHSSWDRSGRNNDYWLIPPGESRVLADIKGPGTITHIWMTQQNHYRQCLLKFTWDDAKEREDQERQLLTDVSERWSEVVDFMRNGGGE